ncbi:MAG TPA: ABC transporter permease [Vicinamibacterales bacterium]
MPLWVRLYRALLSLAPRFKREYGDDATRDYSRLIAREGRLRGRAASRWLAVAGAFDALKAAVTDRAGDAPPLHSVGPDARQALRIWRREPVLALAVAATLAIGIGATTAVYSVVNDILIRPLPFTAEDRLVVLYGTTPRTQGMYGSYADVLDFRRQMRSFQWIGGARRASATWMSHDEARPVSVIRVTDGFLSGLGVRFETGRDFREHEPESAVATAAFARQHFGSPDAALGRRLVLDDGPAEIVGVLEHPVDIPYAGTPELFRPYARSPTEIESRGSNAVLIIARLRPGVTIQEAEAEAKLVQARLAETFPQEREVGVRLTPLRPEIIGDLAQPLRNISAAVLLVFTIVLASITSLLLARAAARAGETAVRLSLGASRARLTRLWLFEALVLAIPGGLAGIALAYTLVGAVRAALPPQFGRLNTMHIDSAALGAAAGCVLLSALVFTLAPRVLGLTRLRLDGVGDATRTIAGLRRARWQAGLIAGQVALSLVLVCCAVWLAASMARLQGTPLGFDPEGVVSARFYLTRPLRMSTDARKALVRRLIEESQSIGGLEHAAVSSDLPGGRTSRFVLPRIRPGDSPLGVEDEVSVVRFEVSPSFFSIFRIPVLRGRVFDTADLATPLANVVVSQSFAERYLPDGDVGTQVALSGREPQTVIGVVADVHADALGRTSDPQLYFVEGTPGLLSVLTLRARDDARINVEDVRAIFRRVAPDMVVQVMPMTDLVASALDSRQVVTRSAYGFAGIALLLAGINVYGLAALTVVQRTREIGIRMALGAAARDASGLIVRRGVQWIVVGAAIGLSAALFLAAPAIRGQLFQTDTGEPALIAAAALIVIATALTALWIPARRAAAIDPAITLRAE